VAAAGLLGPGLVLLVPAPTAEAAESGEQAAGTARTPVELASFPAHSSILSNSPVLLCRVGGRSCCYSCCGTAKQLAQLFCERLFLIVDFFVHKQQQQIIRLLRPVNTANTPTTVVIALLSSLAINAVPGVALAGRGT
jgi:hypothetical protein